MGMVEVLAMVMVIEIHLATIIVMVIIEGVLTVLQTIIEVDDHIATSQS